MNYPWRKQITSFIKKTNEVSIISPNNMKVDSECKQSFQENDFFKGTETTSSDKKFLMEIGGKRWSKSAP